MCVITLLLKLVPDISSSTCLGLVRVILMIDGSTSLLEILENISESSRDGWKHYKKKLSDKNDNTIQSNSSIDK